MSGSPCKQDDQGVKKSDTGRLPLFNDQFPFLNLERFRHPMLWGSLKTRLIFGITLPVVLLMMLTGVVTYQISQGFISRALERSTRLQVMAITHEVESFLDQQKKILRFLASRPLDSVTVPEFLAQLRATQGIDYRSIIYIGDHRADSLLACAAGRQAAALPAAALRDMNPDPLIFFDDLSRLAPGEVWISGVTASVLPCAAGDAPDRRVADHLIYMGTRGRSGYLLIAFNVKALRNILSVFNSPHSPLYAFQRTPEARYSYLFDTDGWMLFQSAAPDQPDSELTTYQARSGFSGTLGRPGIPGAFRPAARHGGFWQMVTAVREGRHDAVLLEGDGQASSGKEAFLAYAPVRFDPGNGGAARVYAGIAYMDISRLTTAAGYKHLDAMFLITLFTAAVVALVITLLGHLFTRPILALAGQVRRLNLNGRIAPITTVDKGREVAALRDAINHMIATVNRQVEEIRQRDLTIHRVSRQVPVAIATDAAAMPGGTAEAVPGIVGTGPRLNRLRAEILKAARVDADVLIQGETGTGKQLAAEAIHRLSGRSPRPFISINCGALDEHLLLDTLFGHVRGAFTEARSDRKGAFLQADGGTLFLDEIQSASPKVQQALLRAVAMRCIRPLGSDTELAVNVRLVTAANVDLRTLIEKEMFREDLFFRLNVIPIHTPALRDQTENIPVLADFFLQQHRRQTGRETLAFSRGALEALCAYRWPGNIRELQHCIMRAVVMTESTVIQADDIALDAGAGRLPSTPLKPRGDSDPPHRGAEPVWPGGLNARQQAAWPRIMAAGGVRRHEYQQWCGQSISPRTAVYDLQDLVAGGHLRRVGRGRSVRYLIAGASVPAERT